MGCVEIDQCILRPCGVLPASCFLLLLGTRILGVQRPFPVVGSIDRFDCPHKPAWIDSKDKQCHSTELGFQYWIRGVNRSPNAADRAS